MQRQQADREGITSIALPWIEADYGGLSKKQVKTLFKQVFADLPASCMFTKSTPGERKV